MKTARTGGKRAAIILGGGSPKNFLFQAEPQIQEVVSLKEKGHDYFIQFTDARADTGGLAGVTSGEVVNWGKIDPDQLSDSMVCAVDSTITRSIFMAYTLAKRPARKPGRLLAQREVVLKHIEKDFKETFGKIKPR